MPVRESNKDLQKTVQAAKAIAGVDHRIGNRDLHAWLIQAAWLASTLQLSEHIYITWACGVALYAGNCQVCIQQQHWPTKLNNATFICCMHCLADASQLIKCMSLIKTGERTRPHT